MKKNCLISWVIGFLLFAASAHASISPLAISIVPPIEFPPSDFDVAGVRLSVLWGEQRQVYGIDLGALGNISDIDFVGIAVAGGFNYNKGESTIVGLQLAGGANVNVNKTHVVGAQIAGGLNSNQAESSLLGIQLALVNYSPFMTVSGLQVGVYNRAHIINGFQIGLINTVDNLHGLQIGLANFNHSGPFAFSPILNVGF